MLVAAAWLWLLGCTSQPPAAPEPDSHEPFGDSAPPQDTGQPGELEAQRGDLVLWGRPAVEPGEEGYELQARIMFCEHAAEIAAVLEPFWGEADTWNGHVAPTGERMFWERISFVEQDGPLQGKKGLQPLLLRPSESWKAQLDMDVMLEHAQRPMERYSQPTLGLALRWFLTEDNHMTWLWEGEGYEHWAAVTGVDLQALSAPVAMQYCPTETTDIASEAFWDRDEDEASRAAWAVLRGWYEGSAKGLREQLLDQPAAVAAVDAVSVGQLAWWLVESGNAEVVLIASEPGYVGGVRH